MLSKSVALLSGIAGIYFYFSCLAVPYVEKQSPFCNSNDWLICLFHAYKRFTLKFLVSKENGRTDKRISKNQCTVYDSALSLLQNALQVKVKVTPVRFVRLCCSKTAIPLHTAVPQTKPITSSVKNVYSAHTRNTYVTLQNT